MLASMARWKSSLSQSDHRPGGGPPALVTRISTAPAAASTWARPSSPVISAAMPVTWTPVAAAISATVACKTAPSRPFSTRSTPASASAMAQPRPNPRDEAQTSARFPRNPKSIPPPPCHPVTLHVLCQTRPAEKPPRVPNRHEVACWGQLLANPVAARRMGPTRRCRCRPVNNIAPECPTGPGALT